MATETPAGKKDTSDYSASKAPDTRKHADEDDAISDPRLRPGGAHGSRWDPGMSSLGLAGVPNEDFLTS